MVSAQTIEKALALHKAGNLQQAELLYCSILEEAPENHGVLHYTGLLEIHRGNFTKAIEFILKAIDLEQNEAKYYGNLSVAYIQSEKGSEALQAIEAALVLEPENLDFIYNKGAALAKSGQLKQAQKIYTSLLEIPSYQPLALAELAQIKTKINQYDEAIDYYRKAVEKGVNTAQFLTAFSLTLERINHLEEARDIAEKAITQDANFNLARYALGKSLERLNELDTAKQELETFLSNNPESTPRAEALYTYGTVLDRLGKTERAYSAFSEANQLAATSPAYSKLDGAKFLARIDKNLAFFSHERIQKITNSINVSPENSPIFFVGFPRSGTTLMERILGGHPDIAILDEKSPLNSVVSAVHKMTNRNDYPELLESLNETQIIELRDLYWQEANQLTGNLNGRTVIDKHPLKIIELGLAKILFPKCRVLVALRDPRDVCISCFMQPFAPNPAMANFLDFKKIGITYAKTMELWLHYRTALGIDWKEYRYEDLVSDFRNTASEVLEFLGLDWHDDLESFNTRSIGTFISTPSYRTVSSELYTVSIGRWENYTTPIAEINEQLAPFIDKFGYNRGHERQTEYS